MQPSLLSLETLFLSIWITDFLTKDKGQSAPRTMAKKSYGHFTLLICGAIAILLGLADIRQASQVTQDVYGRAFREDMNVMPTDKAGSSLKFDSAVAQSMTRIKGDSKSISGKNSSQSAMPVAADSRMSLPKEAIDRSTTLDNILRETTKLLYKNSKHLQQWLLKPFPRIYVYDTLPKEWSDVPTISKCIESQLLDKAGYKNCLWEPKEPCDDTDNPKNKFGRKRFMNYRANYNSDVAYLQWFRNLPGLTTNASQADLFVVPYPHWSHCLCRRNMSLLTTKCPYSTSEIQQEVLDHLEYYEERKERHLFFFGVDWEMVRSGVRNYLADSMTISLGPTCPPGQPSLLCGHFVTPYVDTSLAYQPQAIQPLEWWTNRSRTFSVGAAVSTVPGFVERVELIFNQSTYLGDSVGGLPLRLLDLMEQRRQVTQFRLRAIYNESVFCPILPGDACPQKRFFDVILNGCIPVVPSFTPSDEEGFPTFFRKTKSCSVRRTYPWSQGTFFGDSEAGVNYLSLVVQYNGTCGMGCMKSVMEQVMRNATELKRIRTNLRDYAALVTFGLGENRYKTMDGFSAMLISLRHYLSYLDTRGERTSQ